MALPTHIFDIFHKVWPKQGPRYILCVPTTILGVAEAGEMARGSGEVQRHGVHARVQPCPMMLGTYIKGVRMTIGYITKAYITEDGRAAPVYRHGGGQHPSKFPTDSCCRPS